MNTFLRELFSTVGYIAGETLMHEMCTGYLEKHPLKPIQPPPVYVRENVLENKLQRLSHWSDWAFNMKVSHLRMRYEEEIKRIRLLRRHTQKDPSIGLKYEEGSEEEKTELVEELRARDQLTHDPERERDPWDLTLEDEQQSPESMEEEFLSFEEQHRQEANQYAGERKLREQEEREQEKRDIAILKRAWEHVKKELPAEKQGAILRSYSGILS
jgi:hypothetical protein